MGEFTVDAIQLDVDSISVDQSEVEIDISRNPAYAVFDRSRPAMKRGTRFRFHVPFVGNAGLFGLRPSEFSLTGIRAHVSGQDLIFEVRQLEPDPQAARREFEQELSRTQQMLRSQHDQIDAHHRQLPDSARSLIDGRERSYWLTGRPSRRWATPCGASRDDSTSFSTSSLTQRPKIAAQTRRPPGGTRPFVPEPVLSAEDFDRVLEVVRSLTWVMERSPSAFVVRATEETLRDHLLVQLNGHFEGKAVGEAFNAAGKTDILVREPTGTC